MTLDESPGTRIALIWAGCIRSVNAMRCDAMHRINDHSRYHPSIQTLRSEPAIPAATTAPLVPLMAIVVEEIDHCGGWAGYT